EEGNVAPTPDEFLEVVAHRGRPVLVVADTQDELVRREQLRVEFEVAVSAVVKRKAVALGPGNERQLPLAKLARRRPVERDAVPLEICPAVVGVETTPAPVVVG